MFKNEEKFFKEQKNIIPCGRASRRDVLVGHILRHESLLKSTLKGRLEGERNRVKSPLTMCLKNHDICWLIPIYGLTTEGLKEMQ